MLCLHKTQIIFVQWLAFLKIYLTAFFKEQNMKKIKFLASTALLALSMGSAQAVILTPDLTFSGSHSFDNQVETFEFDVLSNGTVSIWTDTLVDGFDTETALFVRNTQTGAWDWSGISFADATQPLDINGVNQGTTNDFGVAMKNGFISGDANNPGFSDNGGTVALTAGSYLFAVTEAFNISNAELFGVGTLSQGYTDIAVGLEWSTWQHNTGGVASDYNVFVNGDVAMPSAVPVPAAVWLFASAMAGLGVVGRKKSSISVA